MKKIISLCILFDKNVTVCDTIDYGKVENLIGGNRL